MNQDLKALPVTLWVIYHQKGIEASPRQSDRLHFMKFRTERVSVIKVRKFHQTKGDLDLASVRICFPIEISMKRSLILIALHYLCSIKD